MFCVVHTKNFFPKEGQEEGRGQEGGGGQEEGRGQEQGQEGACERAGEGDGQLAQEQQGTHEGQSVQFWALIKPEVELNKVTVSLHHPPRSKTLEKKEEIISRITESMLQTCHVVNQLLLLRGRR
jgi:hypothetical protein